MTTPVDLRSVVLLGVPFHDTTLEETIGEIARLIRTREVRYMATANLDFAAQASMDVELQRILVEAHLVLCDGKPLIWASRWLGAPLRERIAGSDLVPRLAQEAEARGWRVFFLGGDAEALGLACARLKAKHPGLAIEGYSPPFGRLLDLNHEEIAAKVKAFAPDILFVAFGCPKQEKWIYMHHAALGVPVSVGVGATVDFLAGKFRRAPRWMQVSGLEWLFRLMQEPRRLYQRYLIDLLFFVRSLRAQKRVLSAPDLPSRPAERATVPVDEETELIVWEGRADSARLASASLGRPLPGAGKRVVVLDVSAVTFIDSTALGAILSGFRAATAKGGGLVLLRPSEPVRKLFEAVKLDRLILSVQEVAEASSALGLASRMESKATTDELVLEVKGDLTAGRVPEHARWMEEAWKANPQARRLVLDLGGVPFMDSSGLGLLLRAHRMARAREGSVLKLRGVHENPRNVMRISKVDTILDCEENTTPGRGTA